VVVVADVGNHRLALWRLHDGTLWKHLGSEGTQPGQFTDPRAVVVTGSGAMVVTDERRVQVLSLNGAVLCVLDLSVVVGVGSLNRDLWGVAMYPGTNEIFVSDTNNHRVVELTSRNTSDWSSSTSALVDGREWGSPGNQLGKFNCPRGIVVTAAGAVWITDCNNHRLILMH
jgi:tripartite motif-containing protein 71